MSPDERLYMLLEIEKLKQNHALIRSTYTYPTAGLRLSCITFTGESRVVYEAHKDAIPDVWSITVNNKRFNSEFTQASVCLYETLESFQRYASETPSCDVEYTCSIWENDAAAQDALQALEQHTKSELS
ncbi:hypothetical protein PAPHI01_2504 [Pancytospora philotis]|nr:hypothetical protein PAPHI01_2504 [Pancytospora philotis]